ncbi:MAG: NAD-dependent epimerase/dehydratase family protein [Cyclobacteriaceae bacterium]|jgi:nucleoside-diphosphate-sugar epimerase
MHTILGANGIIGIETSRQLVRHTTRIRQVSRNPKKVNGTDELVSADLLNYAQTEKAVAGSEVVYLLAGLKYEAKTWQRDWPLVMQNAINACKKHNAKLVFFDNVYAYGLVEGVMTEETPFNPCSKKGEVRARIATQLLDEIKAKNITGMIVRAADFYGPGATLSLTYSTVTERLRAGKGPQWIGNPKAVHTFTYTPDAGKTVATLGTSPTAFNQTWHALTSKFEMTGEHYARIACEIAKRKYSLQPLPKFGVQMLGLFVPVLREFAEMMYQFDRDYRFDSSKFEKAFHEQATDYHIGIEATLR